MTGVVITKAQTYTVSTYAGSTAGNPTNESIATAKFRSPERVMFDNDNNMIVVDRGNHAIRKINTTTGNVTTIAGSTAGTSGSGYVNDNGTNAKFNNPWGATVDAAGNIYVVERDNYRVRKIAPNGDVSTVGGVGTSGTADNDNPLLATFKQLLDIVIDPSGNLIVADGTGNNIRKIATDGKVTTLAGTGVAGFKDSDDPLQAQFSAPSGLGIDNNGNILVADRNNNRIRKIAPDGKVTTVAGSGTKGTVDNDDPLLAQLSDPYDVDVDVDGNMYIIELAHDVRKIATTGKVTTIAGKGGTSGTTDGSGADARFNTPGGLCVAPDGTIYVADLFNHKIRKIIESTTTPVNLISFTAKPQGTNDILISWQTASEQNSSYFELLKSNDGINWSLLTKVDGKENSTQLINYSYTDTAPFNGTNYYLLKQVDNDGKSSLSNAVNVAFNVQGSQVFNVNYLDGNINVSTMGITISGISTLKISNMNGQVITTRNISLSKEGNKFTIPSFLQPGVYVLTLQSGDNQLYKKIVVEQ